MTGDRGSMSVEAVLLAPVFLLFLLFLVGGARLVEANGEVNGAARDAARAASVQRDFGAARNAARETAEEVLDGACTGAPGVSLAGSDWRQGGTVSVQLTCDVDLSSVGGFGFAPSVRITGTSVVPLEQFRRVDG